MKSSIGVRSFSTRGARSGGLHWVDTQCPILDRLIGSNLVVGILKQENLPLIKMLHTLFALHELELENSKPSIE